MLITIAFVLIAYLLWQTTVLSDELQAVQYALRSLQRESSSPPQPDSEPEPVPLVLLPPVPPPLPIVPEPELRPEPLLGFHAGLRTEEKVPTIDEQSPIPEQTPESDEPAWADESEMDDQPIVARRNWEEAIGGNWLNKIGAVILVIGIALFLGYSFASMGPLGRTLTAATLGSALLAAGLWIERTPSLQIFAYGLIASGWATIYFTAYAAHAIEAAKVIASPAIGMCLMVAAAMAMVVHSLRYRSEPLTALAYACIYAALGLSDLNATVLFALFPLAASMFWISRRLDWTYTTLFSACATYAVFLTRGDTAAPLYMVQGLLLAYWLMFEIMDLTKPSIAFTVNALAGLGAGAYIWHAKSPDTIWIFCSVAAALYLTSAILRAIANQDERPALALSATMTALAIFAQAEGLWTAIFLALEAEALFLAGVHFERPFIQVLSYLAFALSLGAMPWQQPARLSGIIVHACVFYFNRWLRPNLQAFGYLATALTAIAIGLEAPLRLAALLYLALAAALFELGYRKMLAEFRYQGYASALAGAIAALAYRLHPDYLANPWILSGATLLTFAMLIRATKFLDTLPSIELGLIRSVGSGTVVALTAASLSLLVPQAWWGVAWFGAAVVLLELGIRRLPRELVIASLPLMLAGIVRSTFPVTAHPSLALCVIAFVAMVRLLFIADDRMQPIRSMMLAVAAIFGYFAMWDMMPHQWIPVVLGAAALVIAELGHYGNAKDLIIGEIVIAGIASALALFQQPLAWNTALPLVGVHHALAFRHKQRFQTWAATAVAGIWMWSALDPWTCAGFAALSIAMLLLGEKLQSYLCIAVALAFAIFEGTSVPVIALAVTLTAVVASLFLNKAPEVRMAFACVLATSATAMLFQHSQGGMLTLSLGGLGVVLLALGFGATERPLRLNGLAVLLLCILKLFVYDLSSLETIYRIVSFIGLGLILLAVSWVYTRYKSLF